MAPAATPHPTAARVPARRSCGSRPVIAPMKYFRETASSTGRPSVTSRPIDRSTSTLSCGDLAKSGPGSTISWPSRTPRPRANARRSATKATTSPTTAPSYWGNETCFGETRVCMTTSAAPVDAARSASDGSLRPETSLTTPAPAATAAAATAGFHVSTETVTPSATSRSTSGTTRSISTSGGVGSV